MKAIILIGDRTPFLLALKRAALDIADSIEFAREEFEPKLSKSVTILLDMACDTSSQVIKWVWNKLRLNEERIGKDLACLPVSVLGMDRGFIETPEGKVFRDFPKHHRYNIKPLNLYKFLVSLSCLVPIHPNSLSVIKGDAPESLLGALEHDLKAISLKFNYNGTDEELIERFHRVEVNLRNYESLQKDMRKVQKFRKEVDRLKEKIIKRRGNIWQ